MGDFAARDPFLAKLDSQFGEKVLGKVDTKHKILIPNFATLSLARRAASPSHLYNRLCPRTMPPSSSRRMQGGKKSEREGWTSSLCCRHWSRCRRLSPKDWPAMGNFSTEIREREGGKGEKHLF